MRRPRPLTLAVCLFGVGAAGAPTAVRAQGPAEMSGPTPPAPPSPAQGIAPPPPPPAPVVDTPAPLPPPPMLEAQELAPPPTRPRMTLAIGGGVSFESSGLSRTETVPAFFATGGVGADWPVGIELAAFASSATGRFKAPDAPIDRLALALIGVVRPFAWPFAADDARYGVRLLRATGLEVGPGLERDGSSVKSGSRWGLQTGARLEVPIVPAGAPSELRIRLAVRRMFGFYTPQVGTTVVDDGVELYAALVTVF